MKILVTGDSGFLGSHLALALARHHEVTGLSRSRRTPPYDTVEFDLTQSGLPPIRPEVIFHLAADIVCKDEKHGRETNVGGTRKMLELARQTSVKSFILASTGGVYGFGKRAFRETNKANPPDPYARTKREAERLAKSYSRYFPVIILRYFFPYAAEPGNRLVMRLVGRIMHRQPIELNSGGSPVLNPIYIDDAIEATMKSMKAPEAYNIINIAGPDRASILDMVRMMEKELGAKASTTDTGKKIGNMIGDTTKAEVVLHFRPRTRLPQGIKRCCRAFLAGNIGAGGAPAL